MEYEYYMDGNLYCARKHTYDRRADFTKTELWECYNNKGEQICKEGNGEWIIFEDAQKDTLRGPIKNGVMDGEWHGVTHVNRRIEYISKFDKGRFVSGTSYFKGNAYPFTKYVESAEFEKGPLVFIDILRSKVVLPRDSNGRKESFKNISLSFIIEKDGSFSEVKTINTLTELSNDINPKLNEALIAGLMKCKGWSPRKYYGIPLRTKIIYPLEYFHGYVDDRYSKSMTFKEQLIGISDL
jgi:hypothetical protein